MRIVILTAGTRGDTQPYVALAVGLQKAGYVVRVVASLDFESLITDYGLAFAPLRVNMASLLQSQAAQKVMEEENPIKMLLAQAEASRSLPNFEEMQQDVWRACQNADAILFSPGLPIGYFIARYLRIPAVAINVVPMTPTREFPAAMFYTGPRLGPLGNRLSHTLFEQAFWLTFRSSIQQFWRKQDHAVHIPLLAPHRQWRAEGLPVVYGFSEQVLPRPHDWPDPVKISGYWFLDKEPAWSPPAALVAFLKDGPPPIYFGFGSMGGSRTARRYTEVVLNTLARGGQRGVLATGWNGLSNDLALPDHVFRLESAPHAWLFPQMAAVVHHGGAGTTAAGLRAGVPSIIVPHSVDQPMWGQIVEKLGVGPAPIPRQKLTAERLAEAINQTKEIGLRTRARDLGQKIGAEDGVTTAVHLLENILS